MDIKEKDIWVGLDVSTTTIGCTILLNDGSKNGQIIEMTHVSPKVSKKITKDKDEALFIKVEIFREQFLKKYKTLGITKVVIEEPLLNSNNATTCGTLLRFNGMISLAVYEEWGVKPTYVSSYEARKYSFPDLLSIRKYDKNGEAYPKSKILSNLKKSNLVLFGGYPWDIDKKQVLQQKVAEIFPQISWLYDSNGNLKKENYDSSDSYVALLGELNKERYGTLEPKISNIRNEKNKFIYDVKYWDITKTNMEIFC